MDSATRLQLFRGEVVSLDQLEQSNVVRIFVSSTFSDMAVERNILLEKAYPTLRKYCQKRGLDFQVMDMRWGIQDAASVDHSICEICLQEIQTCRRLSVGPYFVGFVGNRYGYRPIPSSIELESYEKFCQIAEKEDIDDRALLKEWYHRDDNAVPPCCILQPITSKYPWFDDNDPANEDRRKTDRESWDRDSKQLSRALRQCAKAALEDQILDEKDAMQFFKSVTELEIEEGIAKDDASNLIYLYLREITDLQQHIEEPSAPKFVDVNQSGKVDNEAQKLLEKLKTDIKNDVAISENIKSYQINWVSKQGINAKTKSHLNYLERFCEDFINDLKSSIDKSVTKTSSNQPDDVTPDDGNANSEKSDWLMEEITHQAVFAQNKCNSFCGRKELIDKGMQQLCSSDFNHPMVVHGSSGKGKTALMAKIIQCFQLQKQSSVVVYRFLGTSPNSSHIGNTLQSLVLQITEACSLPVPKLHQLQNYNNLVQMFSKCISDASQLLEKEDKILVVVLDSLDQLSPQDGAYRLKWLPKVIPSNVKFLLSTLSEIGVEIHERLRRSLPDSCFLEVENLDEGAGKEILETWLTKKKRKLTEPQHRFVMSAFRNCPNPLFLKLAFDEASIWHSYTDVATLKIGNSTREAISMFFDRLEKVHSPLFVSRSIGYIVAAKNGITEGELEDLLSLDNEILDDCYRYWPPHSTKIVRVPALLWARLRHDLGEELVERQTTGYTVIALSSRQFVEVARDRYLGDSDGHVIHRALSEYFLGLWSDGKRKPLKLKIWKNKSVEADRQVSSQPYKFSDRVFNSRKLGELSYHLVCAEMWKELYESVLCNAHWLVNKSQAFSIKDVLDDFDFALERKHDTGISLIRDAIKLAKPTLEFPGGIRNPMCTELFGRLAFFREDFPSTIGKLVDKSSEVLQKENPSSLLPLAGCFQPPGGPLRTTLTGFSKPVTCMVRGDGSSLLAAGSKDGSLIVWEIGDDEVMYTVKSHQDEITCLALSGQWLVSGSLDDTLQVFQVENETKVATIPEKHSNYATHASLAITCCGSIVVSACGEKINVWNVKHLQCKHTFETSSSVAISCGITLLKDELLFAGYSDGSSACWNVNDGKQRFVIPNVNHSKSDKPSDDESVDAVVAQFVRKDSYYSWQKNGHLRVARVENGEIVNEFLLDSGNVIATTTCGGLIATSERNNANLWLVSENSAKHLGSFCHHHDVITTMTFAETDNVLLIGSKDQSITTWSVEKTEFGKNKTPLDIIKGMGASVEFLIPYNDVIASGSTNVFYVKLWNWNRKKVVKDPTTFLFDVKNNSISSCGNYLAIYDNFKETVIFQDLSHIYTHQEEQTVSLVKDKLFNQTNPSESYTFTSLCFLSTPFHLLIGTSTGRLLKVSNPLVKTKQVEKLKFVDLSVSAKVKFLSKSSNGTQVLATTDSNRDSSNAQFHIVNSSDMTLEHSVMSESFEIDGKVSAACFANSNSNEYFLFIGTSSCRIYVISIKRNVGHAHGHYTSQVLQCLTDHRSPITALTLSYDEQFLLSGSTGLIKRLWQSKAGRWKLHREIFFKSLLNAGVTHAMFSKDGKYVVSGSNERSIKIWKVETVGWLENGLEACVLDLPHVVCG